MNVKRAGPPPKHDRGKSFLRKRITERDKVKITDRYDKGLAKGRLRDEMLEMLSFEYKRSTRMIERYISNVRHKQNVKDNIIQARQRHWDDLAGIARKTALEMPLPLTSPCCPDFAIHKATGKEEELVRFRDSDVRWGKNTEGMVQLEIERCSHLMWSDLVSHLVSEFSGFRKKYENWRTLCTIYVGWYGSDESRLPYMVENELRILTDEITEVFKLVAMRRTFKGKCKICKDW